MVILVPWCHLLHEVVGDSLLERIARAHDFVLGVLIKLEIILSCNFIPDVWRVQLLVACCQLAVVSLEVFVCLLLFLLLF